MILTSVYPKMTQPDHPSWKSKLTSPTQLPELLVLFLVPLLSRQVKATLRDITQYEKIFGSSIINIFREMRKYCTQETRIGRYRKEHLENKKLLLENKIAETKSLQMRPYNYSPLLI